MKTPLVRLCSILVLVASASAAAAAVAPRPAAIKPRAATASTSLAGQGPERVIDGVITNDSRWTSVHSTNPSWLELDLGGRHKLAGIHVFSGINQGTALRSFKVQYLHNGAWEDVPSGRVADNKAQALAIAFDDTVEVSTERIRLWITATPDGYARVQELVVWAAGAGAIPPAVMPAAKQAAVVPLLTPLLLNQSGFNLGKPKRFTAPTLPEGTRFVVRKAKGGAAEFEGKVTGNVGDFSVFNPVSEQEYVVEAGGLVSVPFRIAPSWLERVTYQNAVNFMIDSRHHVGNWRELCRGSYGWRDDHHFGWELHTLVPQFLSNPSAYERMPHQVHYEAPGTPALWGKLQPYSEDAPDLVKLIHWGADIVVTQKLTHEHLKAQLAYFLYAWPWLKKWLPEQNYEVVRDYAFACWSEKACDRKYPYDESPEHDLFALKTKIGTTKGCYPPGFSVEPNLLMFEVARREGRPDAQAFFAAAFRQTEWMIRNLDWNDPQTTKGQRMSEFLTLTGLTHFLREYPDRAPAGLLEKIEAWAQVMVRRSANLWDFRKLDDGDRWTPMGEKPTMWNEPGNVVGLPAALVAAQPLVRDPALRARLGELAWSHIDNMFGRNPTGRHFSYDAPREIEGVEHGWFNQLPGGIGMLENARFVIDGSPKNQHYPYHPEIGSVGWTEGWVQFNTAFNNSLAYLAYADTRVAAKASGDTLVIQLTAPLNFDYARVEEGRVVVRAGEDVEEVVVREDSPCASTFTGSLRIASGKAKPGDGILQVAEGLAVEVSYGFGYLQRSARVDSALQATATTPPSSKATSAR